MAELNLYDAEEAIREGDAHEIKMLHKHIDEDVTSIEAELRQAIRTTDEDLTDFRNEVKSRLKGLKNMLTNLESARAGQATQHSSGAVLKVTCLPSKGLANPSCLLRCLNQGQF